MCVCSNLHKLNLHSCHFCAILYTSNERKETTPMIDNRIHYYLALDTETANGLEQPLVYDIGGAIVDKQGRIYEKFSFVIRDIYIHERELMRTAYYADKIPEYAADIREGKREMVNFMFARRFILNLMEKYNVHDVAAYNAHFDRNALNTTIRWLTKSKVRYFFPYGTEFVCIWNMACQTICQRKHTRIFAKKMALLVIEDATLAQAQKMFFVI